jgi:hypothetical protein
LRSHVDAQHGMHRMQHWFGLRKSAHVSSRTANRVQGHPSCRDRDETGCDLTEFHCESSTWELPAVAGFLVRRRLHSRGPSRRACWPIRNPRRQRLKASAAASGASRAMSATRAAFRDFTGLKVRSRSREWSCRVTLGEHAERDTFPVIERPGPSGVVCVEHEL